MIIDLEVNNTGEITFYKKVSCEDDESANNNFDFLAFSIDGIEMGRWDGESDWSLESFPVEAGFHRFEWRYRKDLSTSQGMDGAWIDYITFPGAQDVAPILNCDPQMLDLLMRPDEIVYDTLLVTNLGPGQQDFEIHISSMVPSKYQGGSRSILGSYLLCPGEYVNTGKTYAWTFVLYNASQDNEWIKDLYIDLPPGVEILSTTDFVGGSGGDLIFEGDLGNGALAHWHGEDASNWGVLKGSETATADITLYTQQGLPEDVTINYEVHGDVYGVEPHIISGEIDLINLGQEPTWITLDTTGGSLMGGSSAQVIITINTEGMEEGTYESRLLVNDNFSPGMEIPVTLTVDQTIDIDDPVHVSAYGLELFPNPARGRLNVSLPGNTGEQGIISFYTVSGRLAKRIVPDNSTSMAVIETRSMGNGLYIIEYKSAKFIARKKLLIMNE
jgi:hypothetical protein